jgi:hypothetical protein
MHLVGMVVVPIPCPPDSMYKGDTRRNAIHDKRFQKKSNPSVG